MKRIISTLYVLLLACILCSCSRGMSDTFFVHSIGFEADKNGVTVTALLEKNEKDSDGYFTAARTASSINSAAEKIMSEYKDCYFATCDLYFISHSADSDTISSIAEEICDSNIFPTTADILCVTDSNIENFFKGIKNGEQIRKIKKDSSKNKVNAVSFFAGFSSDKAITVDTFSLTDGEIKRNGETTFVKDRKVVLHEEQRR